MKPLVISLLLFAAACAAQTSTASSSSADEQQVRNSIDQIVQAVLHYDTAALNRLYADDFVALRADGTLQSKQERIQSLSSTRPEQIQVSNVQVRLKGDTAVATLDTIQKAKDGKEVRARFLQVWEKHGGHWQEAALAGGRLEQGTH